MYVFVGAPFCAVTTVVMALGPYCQRYRCGRLSRCYCRCAVHLYVCMRHRCLPALGPWLPWHCSHSRYNSVVAALNAGVNPPPLWPKVDRFGICRWRPGYRYGISFLGRPVLRRYDDADRGVGALRPTAMAPDAAPDVYRFAVYFYRRVRVSSCRSHSHC